MFVGFFFNILQIVGL